MRYRVIYNPEIYNDIQEAVDWYNSQQTGLGKRFFLVLRETLIALPHSAGHFAFRYDNVRCMPIKKFPFLIHYQIIEEQKIIQVEAILSTYRNPITSKERTHNFPKE